MSDGFLSRWSRRKRDALPEGRPLPLPAPEGPEAAPPARPEECSRPPEAQGEITPEELARLPSPDDLTAETDITAFLRRGVPRVLRDAALKRAWALDPKIRDFVCEAREYAYDWNVPGGVPGNGDLLPTDDVAAMVREIFGDRSPDAATAARPPLVAAAEEPALRDVVSQSGEGSAADEAEERPDAPLPDHVAPRSENYAPDPAAASDPSGSERDSAGSNRVGQLGAHAAAQAGRSDPEASAPSGPRRHGRATPI